ncbi:SDR family oxidoreductase [Streptomyces tirandamycinicus]|uniref:Short chain dehydrogenase n=1 Tax=Streptomyces tirandamycinicus TaxID=2174846 RepID=A0A2S1SNE0_9ACTN|nr:SDR family oxidoreductase [Streptomyces tirandamycinicus]AWI27920.1 short chain dehydrogenase [Streptomyces tirandamycinicus]
MELDGRVAVVTGGTRGVGAGIARAFLAAGADVVVCARRPPDAPVVSAGRTARFLPVDLRDPAAVENLFARVAHRHGRLDVLVNNAGGAPYRLLRDGGPARHARVLELNLTAPLTASLAAHGLLRAARGCVVMVGSVSGTRPSPGTAAYGAAKAGLESLARTMAVEWAPEVRVNTIVPGMVRTELSHLHYGDEHGIAAVGRTVPLGRIAEPDEIGDAAVFLASGRAAYISGASLLVHGGGERPAYLGAATAERAAAAEGAVADRGATADRGGAAEGVVADRAATEAPPVRRPAHPRAPMGSHGHHRSQGGPR